MKQSHSDTYTCLHKHKHTHTHTHTHTHVTIVRASAALPRKQSTTFQNPHERGKKRTMNRKTHNRMLNSLK